MSEKRSGRWWFVLAAILLCGIIVGGLVYGLTGADRAVTDTSPKTTAARAARLGELLGLVPGAGKALIVDAGRQIARQGLLESKLVVRAAFGRASSTIAWRSIWAGTTGISFSSWLAALLQRQPAPKGQQVALLRAIVRYRLSHVAMQLRIASLARQSTSMRSWGQGLKQHLDLWLVGATFRGDLVRVWGDSL
jgi:hypothetical protein